MRMMRRKTTTMRMMTMVSPGKEKRRHQETSVGIFRSSDNRFLFLVIVIVGICSCCWDPNNNNNTNFFQVCSAFTTTTTTTTMTQHQHQLAILFPGTVAPSISRSTHRQPVLPSTCYRKTRYDPYSLSRLAALSRNDNDNDEEEFERSNTTAANILPAEKKKKKKKDTNEKTEATATSLFSAVAESPLLTSALLALSSSEIDSNSNSNSNNNNNNNNNNMDTNSIWMTDLRREFDRIDTTRKGSINREDLRKRLLVVPMSIIDPLFAYVDTNNDGCIDFEEYITIRSGGDGTATTRSSSSRTGSTNKNASGSGGSRTSIRTILFDVLNLPIVEVLNVSAVLLCSFLVAVSTVQTLPFIPVPDTSIAQSLFTDVMNIPLISSSTGTGSMVGGVGESIISYKVDALVLINAVLGYFNVLFAFDFILRWYATANFNISYLKKPLVIVDVLVVLIPLSLQQLFPFVTIWNSPGLQNLLLLRILRLRRVLTDINTFSRFEMALGLPPQDVRPFQLQLARVLLSIFTLLSVASGLIYTTEHGTNPDIPDYFAALYFGLTTLTTVGFGDIAPITPGGRFVVCASILAGVAIIPAQAASLLDAILEFQNERKAPPSLLQQQQQQQTSTSAIPEKASADSNFISTTNDVMNDLLLNESRSLTLPEPTTTTATTTTAKDIANDDGITAGLIQEEKVDKIEGRRTSGKNCCHICSKCSGIIEHRTDATYCWSCGAKLRVQ